MLVVVVVGSIDNLVAIEVVWPLALIKEIYDIRLSTIGVGAALW